jgi:hypothetical protein
MGVKGIIAAVFALAILVGLPAMAIWGVVDSVRHSRERRERGGGGGAGGIGAAFQELDRLVARPSVAHVVEAESQVLRREDDQGDPPQ